MSDSANSSSPVPPHRTAIVGLGAVTGYGWGSNIFGTVSISGRAP